MIVYVVTNECDYEEEIVGVCATEDQAIRLMNYINLDESNYASIEKYDTDTWPNILNAGELYGVYTTNFFSMNASRVDYNIEYEYANCRNKVRPFGIDGELQTFVIAKSEDDAKKIASDLFAKYRAEKMKGEMK